jgi:hypothetical protein
MTRIVYVTVAQRDAARLLMKLAEEQGESVSPAVAMIAEAKPADDGPMIPDDVEVRLARG